MTHSDEQLDAFARWERDAWETRALPYAGALTRLTNGADVALLDAAGVGPGNRRAPTLPAPVGGMSTSSSSISRCSPAPTT